MRPRPSRLEARRRFGCDTASELGAPVASSLPEQLPGREQQQARRRDQLVLGSRAHGIVLKCGHVCPSGEVGNKIQKTWRQRVAKMYGQQKRNIIHISSTAYEQGHSPAAPLMS